jgi:hypothetical protein
VGTGELYPLSTSPPDPPLPAKLGTGGEVEQVFQLVQLVHLSTCSQLCWERWIRWRAGELDKGGTEHFLPTLFVFPLRGTASLYPRRGYRTLLHFLPTFPASLFLPRSGEVERELVQEGTALHFHLVHLSQLVQQSWRAGIRCSS